MLNAVRSTTTRPLVLSESSAGFAACPKCGTTKKSGKRSCCAPGGAWFKKCGDAGDTQFDHTWAEGIQACKGVVSSVSAESSLQGMRGHGGVIVYPLNNSIKRNRNVPGADSMSNADSKVGDGITGVIFCASALSIVSHLKTWFYLP